MRAVRHAITGFLLPFMALLPPGGLRAQDPAQDVLSGTARDLCPPEAARAGAAALLGRVLDEETGEPVQDAVVWVRGLREGGPEETPAGEPTGADTTWYPARAGPSGLFLVCALPPNQPLELQATAHGLMGPVERLRIPEGEVAVRDLEVSATQLAADTAGAGKGLLTLRGVVRGAETGEPVEAATVRLLGTEITATTGRGGAFKLEGVPPGRHRVVTEHLGTGSDTVNVDLAAGTPNLALFTLETDPVDLPGLRVEVERGPRSLRLAGFYERMARGVGAYVDREELERRDLVWNLRLIPGVRVEQCFSRVAGRDPNCYTLRMGRGSFSACSPEIYLDGSRLRGRAFTLLQHYRFQLEGIEVYKSGAAAPAQYRTNAACGVILAWTRGRRR